MDAKGLETLLVVALVAALAPIIVAALPGPRVPQVVILIFSGILIGRTGWAWLTPPASSCSPTSGWDSCSCSLGTSSTRGCCASKQASWPWRAGCSAPLSPWPPWPFWARSGTCAKLDAVGYGFFIPVFFVVSGMTLDVRAVAQAPLRLLAFFLLLLVVRGLPSLLIYRRVLPARQRVEMTFITATTMPLLIALAEIGLSDGVMIPANAAALVGAGVLSVLIYPSIAAAIARRAPKIPAGPAAAAAGPGTAGQGGVVSQARAAGEITAEGTAGHAGEPGD